MDYILLQIMHTGNGGAAHKWKKVQPNVRDGETASEKIWKTKKSPL